MTNGIPSATTVLARARHDRWSQLVTLSLVLGAIATAMVGGVAPLVMFAIGIAIVAAVGKITADALDRPYLLRLMLLALGARAILAAIVHFALVANGNPLGALFQDDGGYVITAGALARSWHGQPISAYERDLLSDPSVANSYVGLAAALMWVFGGSILALKLANAVLGVIHIALVYRIIRNLGLPGARLGALAVGFFPSLVLWSVLALKDATALTLMLGAIWSISEFQRSGRWWPWPITIVSLFVLRDIRLYLFAILVVAWPVGLFLAARRRASLAALAVSVVLLILSTNALQLFAPDVLNLAAFTRGWMAEGARSAFVEAPPIAQATPGQAYRVAIPGLTQDPNIPSRRLQVSPGTQLTTDCAATAQPIFGQTPRPLVCVRPGDIVVIGTAASGGPRTPEPSGPPPSPTPVPEMAVRPDYVNVVTTAPPVVVSEDKFDFQTGVVANLEHFPIGLVFLVAAPFPLTARTLTEIALTPDTLLWYLTVAFGVLGIVGLIRRRDMRFAVGLLTIAAVALVLILIEGNVGTLVRHRAMLIPLVVIPAAAEAVRRSSRVGALFERSTTTDGAHR